MPSKGRVVKSYDVERRVETSVRLKKSLADTHAPRIDLLQGV
jgi:hypothetical protein